MPEPQANIVHKFGDSSIAAGANTCAVAQLLDARDAAAGVAGWWEDLARLHTRHRDKS